MPETISVWIAGGLAWVCLLVGFILGAVWRTLAHDERNEII